VSQDIRICFVGDSFVNGTGDEAALGWAGRLCAAAQAKGLSITYYNLGIRRNTSRDILQRWEEECTQRLPESLASVDCRVVFSFGVNDTVIENGTQRVLLQESLDNARLMLQKAQTLCTVLWVGPPPVVDAAHNERIHVLSETFSHLANELNVPYISVLPALVANEEYKQEVKENDGAHPRSEGYAELAHIIGASPQWWF